MTEYRESFARLRELTEQSSFIDPTLLALLLESLPDTVIVIDEGGTILLVNHQCELMFGYARSELLGQTMEILLPDTIRPKHIDHRRHFFENPRSRPMALGRELKGRRRNGMEIDLEINLSPIVTERGMYAVAIVRKTRGDGQA